MRRSPGRGPRPAPTARARGGRARRLDGAGDDGEALGVGVEARRSQSGSGAPCTVAASREHCDALDAGHDVDDSTSARLAAELAEPGAVLGDEVEREVVAAGRHRAHER